MCVCERILVFNLSEREEEAFFIAFPNGALELYYYFVPQQKMLMNSLHY